MPSGLITASSRIHQIKIELVHLRPTVWRRVLVPDAMSLGELHTVLQLAMGWEDAHLHEFDVEGQRFGIPDPDEPVDEVFDDTRATLGLVAGADSRILYRYDAGDCWDHTLTVEAIGPPEPGARYPRCVGGARPCPPEDVGGVDGYREFLAAIRDPQHPDHDELTAWGAGFDPAGFDLAGADKRLEPLAWINSA